MGRPGSSARAARLLTGLAFIAVAGACGGNGGSTTPDAGEPDVTTARCASSSECSTGEVCRDNLCTTAPECDRIDACEAGENCLDGHCAYDPNVCSSDASCDTAAGQICVAGTCRVGCRNDGACDQTERCSEDFECVPRPCPEVPCGDGYECNADTGECELLPCNGGCDAPLRCREDDNTCVECFADEDCTGPAQFCGEDGFCTQQPCESHADCPEGTFCIDGSCNEPPACEDDDLEPNDTYGTGTILSEGTHTGFISCPYNDDFHQVVADGGHSLTVALHFDHEHANLDLELYNTVGVTFARRASLDQDEELTVNIFKTGIYTIRVYQPDGGTVGVPYELDISTGPEVPVAPDLCYPDGFEPNDTPATATPIFTGRWTGPTICAGDQDYYLLHADAGELLRVCLTPSELFGIPLGLEVLDHFGGQLLGDAGVTEFCVENDLLESDDWRIHVFGLNDTDETAYHIEFFIDPGCRLYDDEYDQNGLNNSIPLDEGDAPLTPLPPDTPTDLRVCPNNPDYWPVPLYRRDHLTASITFDHTQGDLQMSLHRPSGSVILSSTGTGDQEAINYQAELDGTHYLRVYGQDGAMGEYTFVYHVDPYCLEDDREDNDTADQASVIDSPGTIADLWRCAGDDDWYSYAIPTDTPATSVTFRTEFVATDGVLDLEVVPPGGGDPIAGTPETGASQVALTGGDVVVGDDSPYLIHVFGAENTQNTYSLTIEVGTE